MGGEGKSGDDLDMKSSGVRQQFFDVFLGIISSVFLRVFVVRVVGVWVSNCGESRFRSAWGIVYFRAASPDRR